MKNNTAIAHAITVLRNTSDVVRHDGLIEGIKFYHGKLIEIKLSSPDNTVPYLATVMPTSDTLEYLNRIEAALDKLRNAATGLKRVRVCFKDAALNYTTHVSGDCAFVRRYFVGNEFNFNEQMHRCIGVEFKE